MCSKQSYWYERAFLPYPKNICKFLAIRQVAPPLMRSHCSKILLHICVLYIKPQIVGCGCWLMAVIVSFMQHFLFQDGQKYLVTVNVTSHFVLKQCYKFSFRSADPSADSDDLIVGSYRPDMPLMVWVQLFVIESVCNLAAIMPLYLQSGCISGLYAFRRQRDWITQRSFHQKSVVLTFAAPFPRLPHPKPACQLSADNSLIGL